jgi:hypothetical protein
MAEEAPRFHVGELDGCRLIEITWPPRGTVSRLAEFILAYYDLWEQDVERATVLLSDLRAVESLNDEEYQIVRTILGRVRIHPGFVAGAFYYGENTMVRDVFVRILGEAGRVVDSVFEDRAAAIEYLRTVIGADSARRRGSAEM